MQNSITKGVNDLLAVGLVGGCQEVGCRDAIVTSALRAACRFVDSDEFLFGSPGGAVAELDLDLAGVGQRRQIALRGGPRYADLCGEFSRRHRLAGRA